ncbi:MAG: hypothetical protein H7238_16995 [Polaromonas sp.]|nr:hypothetical protein [Polaromonas sp.]
MENKSTPKMKEFARDHQPVFQQLLAHSVAGQYKNPTSRQARSMATVTCCLPTSSLARQGEKSMPGTASKGVASALLTVAWSNMNQFL